jgi:hypothetical protein
MKSGLARRREGRGAVVSILGFFIVVLAVLFGVAVIYDLRSRHRRRLPGSGARRAEQDRRSDARARPESIRGDAGTGMGGGFDL